MHINFYKLNYTRTLGISNIRPSSDVLFDIRQPIDVLKIWSGFGDSASLSTWMLALCSILTSLFFLKYAKTNTIGAAMCHRVATMPLFSNERGAHEIVSRNTSVRPPPVFLNSSFTYFFGIFQWLSSHKSPEPPRQRLSDTRQNGERTFSSPLLAAFYSWPSHLFLHSAYLLHPQITPHPCSEKLGGDFCAQSHHCPRQDPQYRCFSACKLFESKGLSFNVAFCSTYSTHYCHLHN